MHSNKYTLLLGKPVATSVYARLSKRVSELSDRGITPGLAVVLVGDDPASQVYVGMKTKRFADLGLHSETLRLPAQVEQSEMLDMIHNLNADPRFHGILIQLPLPRHLDSDEILFAVSPEKDVDGFHPLNLGRLFTGNPRYIPCTPQGVLEILEYYNIHPAGQHVVIVGRSLIVGKPMFALLAHKWSRGNATVTMCHTGTTDLRSFTTRADILIVASGAPGLIRGNMVKQGAVVIDVGTNRVPDSSDKGYHLAGDVQFDEVAPKVSAITPVPKGVGPMTIAMLVQNTVLAAENTVGANKG